MSISGISWNSPYTPNLQLPFSSHGSWSSSQVPSGSESVQQDGQTGRNDSQQSANSSGLSGIQQDFQNLTSALSSGDLVAAQQAFAALQQDLQKAVGHRHYHHHHHGGDNEDNRTASGVDSGSNAGGTGAELDVTITLVNITAGVSADSGTGSQVNLTA